MQIGTDDSVLRIKTIVVVAFDRANLLDISGPIQVFATAGEEVQDRRKLDRSFYDVKVASLTGGMVTTSCGVHLSTVAVSELASIEIDTLLVSGGGGWRCAIEDADLIAWLGQQQNRVRRIGSICTGAFVASAAGLLKGKRATTHWASCAELSLCSPGATIEQDTLFVRDGNLWTSAGVTAGIDMALAMVEQDCGNEVALETARQLVLFLKRSGGQPQFSTFLRAQMTVDDNLSRLATWILENPAQDHDAELLAKRANMSVRTLFRSFHDQLGTTPKAFVERARLESARRLLEQSADRIDRVAVKAGFPSTEAMRRAFSRHFQITPLTYRERFASANQTPKRGSAHESRRVVT